MLILFEWVEDAFVEAVELLLLVELIALLPLRMRLLTELN